MAWNDEASWARWRSFSVYQRFEQVVILSLVGLIAIVIVAALWSLALKVLFGLILSGTFDPTDHVVFQTVFGMIFTVIIALEFKRSLLVVAERRDSVVQVRTVVLLGLLAVVRKLLILDLNHTEVGQLFGLVAAILALGTVYWLIRDQDRRRDAQPVET
jgi:uncharacterized membrane protein (DUF373 family)